MTSSITSTWESAINQKFSSKKELGKEALITTSTRELVEFYWTSRKRFSGGYRGFPAKSIKKREE